MKNTKYLLLTIAVVFTTMNGQETAQNPYFTQMNLPNFLINNQLADIIYLEYGGLTLGDGTFNNPDGNEINRFSRANGFTVQGLPVQLVNKRQSQLYLGFGYTQTEFKDKETGGSFLDKNLHRVHLSAFWDQQISDRYYLFSYGQLAVSGDKPFDKMDKTLSGFVLEKLNYKYSREMNFGLGLFYNSNLGDPVFLPALAFAVSGDQYVFDFDFPNKVEFEWLVAKGSIRPTIGMTFPFGSYHLSETGDNVSYLGNTAYAGVKYEVFSIMYLHAFYHYNFAEKYEFGKSGNLEHVGDLSGNATITLTLRMQIAKFIPFIRGQ
jgi:hypothetical protein